MHIMGVEVEPEEAGRVEAAEECGVRGVPEPALGDGGGADEAGGEVEAEEVIVAEHHGDLGRGDLGLGLVFSEVCIPLTTRCLRAPLLYIGGLVIL